MGEGGMRTTHTPPTRCLNCGAIHDAASGMNHNKQPYPGAITMCAACSAVMKYGENMELAPLDDADVQAIKANPQAMLTLGVAAKFITEYVREAEQVNTDDRGNRIKNSTFSLNDVCPQCGGTDFELRHFDMAGHDGDIHCYRCGRFIRVYDAG